MSYRNLVSVLVTSVWLAGCGQEPSAPEVAGFSATPPAVMSAARAGFGGITIVLDADPNAPLDVAFVTMGKKLRDFALDDDADPTLPSTRTFTRLKAGE